LLLPLQTEVRLRGAARAHLNEGGDAVEHDRQAMCIDAAAFVDQFRQQLQRVVGILQPLGGVVQQFIRLCARIGEIVGVADDPGLAENVIHEQLLAECRILVP